MRYEGDPKPVAEWQAKAFIDFRSSCGDRLKDGAYENLTYAFLNKLSVDEIVAVADKFTYGKHIMMPWGKEVLING